MVLADIHNLKAVTERHGFTFSKDFGQNFLIDPAIPERIAEVARVQNACAVEVGPGMGTLTQSLASRARAVACLELDRRLLPVLAETMAEYANVTVTQGDVLKTDLARFADDAFGAGTPTAAVSNLPYCITTKAVLALLGCKRFYRVTVMIQKEAARKLLCKPGDPEWCLFSAKAAFYGAAENGGIVSKGCFYPAPTVDSQVVSLDCAKGVADCDAAAYAAVAEALFSARRKSIKNCLTGLLQGATEAQKLADAAGLDAGRRGETLTPGEIADLARIWCKQNKNSV